MVVLYSDAWAKVSVKPLMQYGTLVEITGKWNKLNTRVVSVYRPCINKSPGSLRSNIEPELSGTLDGIFWDRLADAALQS